MIQMLTKLHMMIKINNKQINLRIFQILHIVNNSTHFYRLIKNYMFGRLHNKRKKMVYQVGCN